MRNAGLEEAQAGIKMAGRNINNLRYADDTTLMAETEEELKSLLMEVKEESQRVGHDWATELNWCFIDYAKAFDCVDHNKLWKSLREMEISDHLTCLLRNLYAG